MKNKFFTILLLIFMITIVTGCGKTVTLESYLNDNSDVKNEIVSEIKDKESKGGWDVDTSFSENTVTISEKTTTSGEVADYLADGLRAMCEEDNGASFQDNMDSIIKMIKEKTKLNNNDITICKKMYKHDGSLIWSGDFNESSSDD